MIAFAAALRRLVLAASALGAFASAAAAEQAVGPGAAPPAPKELAVVPLGDGDFLHRPVLSYAQLRFKDIERQTLDLSCGAAAIATLLHHYFNLDATERSVIRDVVTSASAADRAKIGESGFSMLELKHYAESRGLIAGGFRTPNAEDLRKLRAPAIALVNSRGFKHFVVIRHVRGDEVAFADPVFGNRTESLDAFARRWNNVILVVVSPGRVVNAKFMEAPGAASDSRAVQLLMSAFTSPPLIAQPGEYY